MLLRLSLFPPCFYGGQDLECVIIVDETGAGRKLGHPIYGHRQRRFNPAVKLDDIALLQVQKLRNLYAGRPDLAGQLDRYVHELLVEVLAPPVVSAREVGLLRAVELVPYRGESDIWY